MSLKGVEQSRGETEVALHKLVIVLGPFDAVGVESRGCDLIIDDGVDLHGDVILGDHGLRRIVEHLLLQADLLGHALNERDFDVQTLLNAPRRSIT